MSAHVLASLDSGMSSLADSYATSKTSSTPGSPSDEGIHEKPYVSLPFFCLECSIGFEDDVSLERHAEDAHDPQKLSLSIDESTNELDSDSCDISVSSKLNDPISVIPAATLILPKPVQTPQKPHIYFCENCDSTFTDAMHLNEHHRSEHEEYDDVYNCSLCEKKFVDRKGLLFHTRNIHKPPSSAVTPTNPPKDNQPPPSTPTSHMENRMDFEQTPDGRVTMVNGVRVKGNVFRASSYPRRPNPVGVVVGEKPKGEANWHKTIENGEEKIEMSVEKQEGDRPYGCEICGSRFKLKAVLMRHIRCVHSESRPYLCSYCGSSFKIRNRLTTHIKMVHPQYLHEYVREWRNGNAIKPIPIVINSPN